MPQIHNTKSCRHPIYLGSIMKTRCCTDAIYARRGLVTKTQICGKSITLNVDSAKTFRLFSPSSLRGSARPVHDLWDSPRHPSCPCGTRGRRILPTGVSPSGQPNFLGRKPSCQTYPPIHMSHANHMQITTSFLIFGAVC